MPDAPGSTRGVVMFRAWAVPGLVMLRAGRLLAT